MKRIRKLAKPNAYAATVSRHIRRLSSGSAGASNRRSGVQVPVPEDASVASATSISMNSSCNTDVSDFDGDAPQDGEEEQVSQLRQKGRGSSPLPQASQSLCLHVIEEQRSVHVPQLCQAWGEFPVIDAYLLVVFCLFGDGVCMLITFHCHSCHAPEVPSSLRLYATYHC